MKVAAYLFYIERYHMSYPIEEAKGKRPPVPPIRKK